MTQTADHQQTLLTIKDALFAIEARLNKCNTFDEELINRLEQHMLKANGLIHSFLSCTQTPGKLYTDSVALLTEINNN